MTDFNFFSDSEFERCSPPCKRSDMDKDFMNKLNRARKISGVPFILSSAYRSSQWDESKGRSGKGMHTLGRAVDIRVGDSFSRGLIIKACMRIGLNGIGIASTFIHIDDRETPNIWLY